MCSHIFHAAQLQYDRPLGLEQRLVGADGEGSEDVAEVELVVGDPWPRARGQVRYPAQRIGVAMLFSIPVLGRELKVRQSAQPALHHVVRVQHGVQVGQRRVICSHHNLLLVEEVGPLVTEV